MKNQPLPSLKTRLRTKQFFNNFFPSHILTFVSDRTMDFSLFPSENDLREEQRKHLQGEIEFDFERLINIRQVHGDRVVVMRQNNLKEFRWRTEADGILTDVAQLPITVRTADCLSVFLYDARHHVIGLIHAGWRGTQQRIVLKALNIMHDEWSSDVNDISIAFGPAIRPCCYQVGEEFLEYFPNEVIKKDSRYYLDLLAVHRKQLLGYGIKADQIYDCNVCTHCHNDYFSFRREKEAAGRMISLMMMCDKR